MTVIVISLFMALLKTMDWMQKFLLADDCLLIHVLTENDLGPTDKDFAKLRGITLTSSI